MTAKTLSSTITLSRSTPDGTFVCRARPSAPPLGLGQGSPGREEVVRRAAMTKAVERRAEDSEMALLGLPAELLLQAAGREGPMALGHPAAPMHAAPITSCSRRG